MIKLQTDFHLSTIIKKGADVQGGSKYTRRQMSARRASVLGANVWNRVDIYIAISCGIIDISSNLLESLSLQHPNLQHVFSMGTFNYYKGQTLQPHVTSLYR